LHVVAAPLGQTTGSPVAQDTMSQSSVPAVAAGHVTTQVEPAAQLVWQGPAEQVNWQLLFGPQLHMPSAHVPAHEGLSPAQVTWQGGAPQRKSQRAFSAQVQSPFAHVPLHVDLSSHSTWQGGATHSISQLSPAAHSHVPLEQLSS
jgi:hypothetical protein